METESLFSAAEVRALLELGIRHHGRYLTEGEYRGILAWVVKHEDILNAVDAKRTDDEIERARLR